LKTTLYILEGSFSLSLSIGSSSFQARVLKVRLGGVGNTSECFYFDANEQNSNLQNYLENLKRLINPIEVDFLPQFVLDLISFGAH